MRKRAVEEHLPPSDRALASRMLRPGPRQRDPWECRSPSSSRVVRMMRVSGAASLSRGTPPTLDPVMESPSTSGELPPASVLEQGTHVTGVVTAVRPAQITLALESERDAVEPIAKLRMATLKHGEPIEKGMRLSGLEITFAQPE